MSEVEKILCDAGDVDIALDGTLSNPLRSYGPSHTHHILCLTAPKDIEVLSFISLPSFNQCRRGRWELSMLP